MAWRRVGGSDRARALRAVVAVGLITLTLPVLTPHPGGAASGATAALEAHVRRVLALVQTPAFLAQAPEARHAAVRGVLDELFDWRSLARMTLGVRWAQLSAGERDRFTRQFSRLAERAYMWLVDRYDGRRAVRDPLRVAGETEAGNVTVVHTVLGQRGSTDLDFRMVRHADAWRIEDVIVDGVSITANYRAQIAAILERDSFDGLMDRMAARVQAGEAKTTSALPRAAK